MNCKRIRARLDLLAGDDLAGRDAAEVEAHLRQCLSCYREYVEMRDVLGQVRATSGAADVARSEQTSDAFVRGVMSQIQGPPPAAPRLLPRLTMVSGWAAALVLGLTVGWYRWHLERPGTPPESGPVIENPDGMTTINNELRKQIGQLRGRPRTTPARPGDDVKPALHRSPKNF